MKKILLTITMIVMFMSVGMYVNATENIVNVEGDNNIPVRLDIVSEFEITIPSEIVLNYGTTTEFNIKSKGRIPIYEYLCVSLPETLTMKSEGQEDENLGITTSCSKFTREQLLSEDGGIMQCNISSNLLPTGIWNGELYVSVFLEDMYYRLPDNITFEHSYFTIMQKGSNTYMWNHAEPLFYYAPEGKQAYLTDNETGINNFKRYGLQSDGTWKFVDGGTFGTSSSYNKLQLSLYGDFVYINYDIMYADSPSEIWQSKICQE